MAADPAEVVAVHDAFVALTTQANKKLAMKSIWAYYQATYVADSVDVVETDIMNDVRKNPGKYNILF